jgi:hypothetical protein
MSQNPISRRSTRTVSGWRSTVLLLALALLLRAAPLAAQPYTLAPPPYQTVLNNTGAPVSNACVWTYSAGTTTPIATYSTATGTVNTNPIRTDSAGRFTAYLVPGTGYAFTYELPCTPPAHGVVLRTADNISGPPAASIVTSGTWFPSLGGTATYTLQEGTWARVGAIVFARGRLTVNALGTGNQFVITGLPFPVAGETGGTIYALTAAGQTYGRAFVFAPANGTQLNVAGQTAPATLDTFLSTFFTASTAAVFSITYLTTAP